MLLSHPSILMPNLQDSENRDNTMFKIPRLGRGFGRFY